MNPKSAPFSCMIISIGLLIIAIAMFASKPAHADENGKCSTVAAKKVTKPTTTQKRQKSEVTATVLPEKPEVAIPARPDVGAMSGVTSTHLRMHTQVLAFTDTTPDDE
jgi:hypothetical protein